MDMDPHKPSQDERDFVRVVKVSIATGLGLLAAFLASIRQVHPDLKFRFGLTTVLAFSATAVFSWIFCGVLFKGEFSGDSSAHASAWRKRRVRRWLFLFLFGAVLATVSAFVYSLKDVSNQSRWEVIQGTGIAVLVLTGGGFLIHKSVRFFEEQDRASLEHQKRQEEEQENER
jgi:hypothetical protein